MLDLISRKRAVKGLGPYKKKGRDVYYVLVEVNINIIVIVIVKEG